MRLVLRATSLAISIALCGSASPEPGNAFEPGVSAGSTVIVLSWDGVRHDQLDREALPALARMLREGAHAEALVPPFPSNTFPSHVTLATGTHPDRHGIVGNRFLDPVRGLFDYEDDASWIEAEPLWVAAERQGVRSAAYFWVGSQTDWRGTGASLRRAPFSSKDTEAEKVDQLLAWLDLPTAERPRLLMSWWHGADREAHRRGPDDEQVAAALAEQDAELARLLAGIDARKLWDSTTLIVVSDHGMLAASRPAHDVDGALERAGAKGRLIAGGGMAHVYLEPGADREAALEALAHLPGVRVFPRDALPEAFRARHPRMGDLVLVSDPPLQFARASVRRLRFEARGAHGFDPAVAQMHGIFVALGRGVKPGATLPRMHGVDLAPSAAALLGIEPPADSEGTARLPMPGSAP